MRTSVFTLHHQIETVAQRIEQRKTLYQILICIAGVMIKLLRIRRRRSLVRIQQSLNNRSGVRYKVTSFRKKTPLLVLTTSLTKKTK